MQIESRHQYYIYRTEKNNLIINLENLVLFLKMVRDSRHWPSFLISPFHNWLFLWSLRQCWFDIIQNFLRFNQQSTLSVSRRTVSKCLSTSPAKAWQDYTLKIVSRVMPLGTEQSWLVALDLSLPRRFAGQPDGLQKIKCWFFRYLCTNILMMCSFVEGGRGKGKVHVTKPNVLKCLVWCMLWYSQNRESPFFLSRHI